MKPDTVLTAEEPQRPWRKTYPLLFVVAVTSTLIISTGLIWNVALIADPDLAFLFWLYPLAAVYFAASAALISVPLWLPQSLLFAWLIDRSRLNGNQLRLRHIAFINAWTMLAAGITFGIAHINTSRLNNSDIVAKFTANYVSGDIFFGCMVGFGCIFIPILWSVAVARIAIRRKQYALHAVILGIVAILINVAGLWAYSIVKVDQQKRADIEYTQQLIDKQHKDAIAQQRAAKQQQTIAQADNIKAKQNFKNMQLTPYIFPTTTGSTVHVEVAGADKSYYGQPQIKISGTYAGKTYETANLAVEITEVKTTEADPSHKSSGLQNQTNCYPMLPGYKLARETDFYMCSRDFGTNNGTPTYQGPTLNSTEPYRATHIFVRDGIFVSLYVNDPKRSGDFGNIGTIIDSLSPANLDDATFSSAK